MKIYKSKGKLPAAEVASCVIPVRLTPKEHKAFTALCKAEGIPYRSRLATAIIRDYILDYREKHVSSDGDRSRKKGGFSSDQ